MVFMIKKIITIFLVLPLIAHGACNSSAKGKACPTSGTTLLDDTYPAAAHVISIDAYERTKASAEVPSTFVLKVLESYNYSDDAPPIIIPSSTGEFEELMTQLKSKIAGSGGKIPNKVLDKVLPAESGNYTWQQDYFESFVDLNTGRPVLREIIGYDRQPDNSTQGIGQTGKLCQIVKGDDIKSFRKRNGGRSTGNGEMGGNIEGLPGGLCLVGNNQDPNFTAQFCGSQRNLVQVDVDFLAVGHVDELFKVVPTKRPGVPDECNFSLMFASPDKALELLAQKSAANHPFFDHPSLGASATAQDKLDFRASRTQGKTGKTMCDMLSNVVKPRRGEQGNDTKKGGGAVIKAFLDLRNYIISPAYAAAAAMLEDECDIETLTNAEFRDGVLNTPELKEYNQHIQKSINESKKKIINQVLSRLPQCKPYLLTIDVPDLFYGTLKVNADGTKELPKPGTGGSLMPNPTNSVMSNKTLIISDPQSGLFKDYMKKELEKSGVKSTFIDTWDYAHLGDGNLHCSSHTIPYCNPVKGK